MGGTLIILPTYNEAENVEPTVSAVRRIAPTARILVVDDGSPDGTGLIAQRLSDADPAISVLHRTGKAGLGSAYRAAYRWALDAGFDTIVQMDADGSHRPDDLPSLLSASLTSDVVIGSRWVRGGDVVNWPLRRILLSRGGSAYARLGLDLPFRDITGGFRVFRAGALRLLRASDTTSEGYCFQVEMLMRSHDAGLLIVEKPITFVERVRGESKMSAAIVHEAVVQVSRWTWGRLRSRVTPGQDSRPLDHPTATASR